MGTNKCEVEYKIHNLLTTLKKEDQDKYLKVKRILTYLYKTVKVDYFEKQSIESAVNESNKETSRAIDSVSYLLFKEYINSEDGILDNLIKMCQEPNSNYFSKFYEGIEIFLEMAENNLYSEYGIYKYVFNMYVMLKAYQEQDYNTYASIVDDFSSFFITSILDLSSYSTGIAYFLSEKKPEILKKKRFIDFLVSHKEYKNFPIIHEKLKEVLDYINIEYDSDIEHEYDILRDKYEELYKAIDEFKEKHIEIDRSVIDRIKIDLFDSVKQSYKIESYRRNEEKVIIRGFCINYFSKILLIGKRYDFIKQEINEIETNPNFINEILSYVGKMDYQLFEYMNKELSSKEDSFITCMRSCFDSDTYQELINKLNAMVKASKEYQENPKEALKIIETLNTNEHKEVRNGIVLSWPQTNSINQISKPKTILERTIALQKDLDFAPDERDFHYFHTGVFSCRSIADFIERISNKFSDNEKEAEEKQLKLEQDNQLELAQKQKTKKGLLSYFSPKE